MRFTSLGHLEQISRLALGGGGLGQVWGETTRGEAVETMHAAIDAGINLIDAAPIYGDFENVIADAFAGDLPAGVRITTKVMLGEQPVGEAGAKIRATLEASLEAMNLDRVDLLFLHSNICEDDYDYAHGNQHRAAFATPWSQYLDEVIPTFEALTTDQTIGGWALTGTGVPATILKALTHETKPDVVQAVANLMDSPGGMRRYGGRAQPREIIATATALDIGVMGIRAVQAGALTDAIDRTMSDNHPETTDFRAAAPYRELCARLGLSAAATAHRYALDMTGVDTVVLGVKNRTELAECIAAEAAGPLPEDIREQIDELGLRIE